MKKHLIPFLFISLFILHSCADAFYLEEEKDLEIFNYISCEWLFCSYTSVDTLNSGNFLLPFWIIDTTSRASSIYKLTNATDTPLLWGNDRYGPDEYRTEIESKYIHYFEDEGLIKFERTSDAEKQTISITYFIDEIQYKCK